MNASGGMHRKFGRREPIVFKRSSIPPRTAGRWPRAQRWPEPLRQALEHVMLAGEYLCVYNFSFPRHRCVDDGGRRTTDPMAATTMRTVIACAVRDPQASSSTLEATDVAVFNSSRGIEPSASVASPRHGRRRRSGSSAARECRVLSLRAEIQTTATEVLSGRRHPVQTPDKAV